MTDSFLSILPNLSIGVIAIGVLGASYYFFVRYLEKRDAQQIDQQAAHMLQLDDRERHARKLEQDFRSQITEQLTKNTVAMAQSSAIILECTKTMERMLARLDK